MFERFKHDKTIDLTKQRVRKLLSAQGEVNAQSMALKVIESYRSLNPAQREVLFDFLATEFNPSTTAVKTAADAYCADPSAHHLIQLMKVSEPKRQELLRRINRAPNGTEAILAMREALLPRLREQTSWAAIDFDMHHLLSSWFNPGFLELHEITWNSPAQLLEKIIQHESVHAINGWDELRRRLQPDRRCFAFFHRQLPNEPLIFVEVALVPHISTDVGVLIDKHSPVGESKQFKAAIFYSISNCQPGLRGVSLGNFLIKRVAQKLIEEIPSLQTFCTLSPIPGLVRWIDAGAVLPSIEGASSTQQRKWDAARQTVQALGEPLGAWLKSGGLAQTSPEMQAALMRLSALYLRWLSTQSAGDPVAKFHLSNGATLYQINWAADLSKKGVQQSAGIMVNYLYELDKVEKQHEAFSEQNVAYSRHIEKWLK